MNATFAARTGVVVLAVTEIWKGLVHAQSSDAHPQFEVASIKPSGPDAKGFIAPLDNFSLFAVRGALRGGGRFSVKGVPLNWLILLAYNIKDFQVSGGPAWANSDRYDIDAKAEGNATTDQMRSMLQSLLADRFKLMLRHEKRELPLYELSVAKGSLKIVAATEGSCVVPDPNGARPPMGSKICGGIRRGVNSIDAFGISMSKLSVTLSDIANCIVIDKTGFAGTFDAHLEFAPDDAVGSGIGQAAIGEPGRSTPSAASSSPSLFTAFREQLGLRLESAKGPVEVLVISHVERPTAN